MEYALCCRTDRLRQFHPAPKTLRAELRAQLDVSIIALMED